MRTSDFDYHLPEEQIAALPAARREDARLLVLAADAAAPRHLSVRDLPGLLRRGDLLVLNESRVIPARLLGRRAPWGGRVEVLLTRRLDESHPEKDAAREGACRWEALVRPGKKIHLGDQIIFDPGRLSGRVEGFGEGAGARVIALEWRGGAWSEILESVGKTPLPPYILRRRQAGSLTYPWDDALTLPEDRERYQTVYARRPGSVAAPTAGLHFSPELLADLERLGIEKAFVTLHIGPGTFQKVECEDPAAHEMHEEAYELSEEAAAAINKARGEGRRVIAVGTTAVRVLETVARETGEVRAGGGATRLFILPGFEFRVVDAMLTNFHLPRSTLLMLVCAFAGRERVLAAYEEAVREGYRFYSYGDATYFERR